jgi:hypothetical protein
MIALICTGGFAAVKYPAPASSMPLTAAGISPYIALVFHNC